MTCWYSCRCKHCRCLLVTLLHVIGILHALNSVNCTDDVSQAAASESAARYANLFRSQEYLYVIKCCSICEEVTLTFEIITPRVCRAAALLCHTTHRTSLLDRSCLPLGGTIWPFSLLPAPIYQTRNKALNKTNSTAFYMYLLEAGQSKHISPTKS